VEVAPLAVSAERARLALLLGVCGLVALLSCLYVSQTSAAAAAGYHVGSLASTRDRLRLQNDQLSLQIAEARSVATVEREATRLGVAPPEGVIYLRDAAPAQPVVILAHPSPKQTDAPVDLFSWLRDLW
jgi:hypothetical protein